MKNTKAQVGQILIFVAVVALSAGFVYAVYITGNQLAAEIFFKDDQSSFSLVSDAVVNSPSCLLRTETKDVASEKILAARRGVIDWNKAASSLKGCVKKGPYLWNAAVKDETQLDKDLKGINSKLIKLVEQYPRDEDIVQLALKAQEAGVSNDDLGKIADIKNSFAQNRKEIKSYDSSKCNYVGKRSIPVIINRIDHFDKGSVEISVASKDLTATLSRKTKEYEATIKNIGTCKSQFKVSASIINTETGELEDPLKTETTGEIEVNKTATFKVEMPDYDLKDKSIKIEISPSDIDYYIKIYKEKL